MKAMTSHPTTFGKLLLRSIRNCGRSRDLGALFGLSAGSPAHGCLRSFLLIWHNYKFVDPSCKRGTVHRVSTCCQAESVQSLDIPAGSLEILMVLGPRTRCSPTETTDPEDPAALPLRFWIPGLIATSNF